MVKEAYKEMQDTEKYIGKELPNKIKKIHTIGDVVKGVCHKFKDLNDFKGLALEHLYNDRKQNELDYHMETQKVIDEFREVPGITVYEEMRANQIKQRRIAYQRKMGKIESNKLELVKSKKLASYPIKSFSVRHRFM